MKSRSLELKKLIKQGGTQIEFSQFAGLTREYVSMLCNGKYQVHNRYLVLAKMFAKGEK